MDPTEKRVNRIVGQMKGIERMVKDKRDCGQVLQQISAVKKAIDALTKEIVVSEVCQSLPADASKRTEKLIEQAINL